MIFADKLLMGVEMFPTGLTPPTSYTTQTIVDLSNTANYSQGTFAESGWYRVKIGAADGQPLEDSASIIPGKGGYASQIFYAFNGTKFLIWGCNGTATGYPWPQGNGNSSDYGILGGGGAGAWFSTYTTGGHIDPHTGRIVGSTTIVTSGGYGGGSPTGNGGTRQSGESTTYFGTEGGAGAGFICGLDITGTTLVTETESFSDHTFSVNSVIAMVLAGGGGGCTGHAGAGGGAYGNGGTTDNDYNNRGPGTGPGDESFGRGGNTPGSGGHGGDGAWCVRDYSTGTFSFGTGINSRPAAQVCILEKLIY